MIYFKKRSHKRKFNKLLKEAVKLCEQHSKWDAVINSAGRWMGAVIFCSVEDPNKDPEIQQLRESTMKLVDEIIHDVDMDRDIWVIFSTKNHNTYFISQGEWRKEQIYKDYSMRVKVGS